MWTELIAVVERLTGRKVAAFMSDNFDPDVAVETFALELLAGDPIASEDDTGAIALT